MKLEKKLDEIQIQCSHYDEGVRRCLFCHHIITPKCKGKYELHSDSCPVRCIANDLTHLDKLRKGEVDEKILIKYGEMILSRYDEREWNPSPTICQFLKEMSKEQYE